MAEQEWTPARGWAVAGLHLPIRALAGLAIVVAGAWGLDAILDAVGTSSIPLILACGFGAAGGALAGLAVCAKLVDCTGLAGRSLLPLALVALAIVQVGAWYLIEAWVPWAPQARWWFVAMSSSSALLIWLYLLWANG